MSAMNVDRILEQYADARRDALIPILQDIQSHHGYLSPGAIDAVAQFLNLPPSKIYGVATFYNQFRFRPVSRYHVLVCRGTNCHLQGGATVLETIRRVLAIDDGQATRDGLFSLGTAKCMGGCKQGPSLSVNGVLYSAVTPAKVRYILDSFRVQGGPLPPA